MRLVEPVVKAAVAGEAAHVELVEVVAPELQARSNCWSEKLPPP